ncbi:MAG: efflux RND transporter permease subunit [Pirellula sp.]
MKPNLTLSRISRWFAIAVMLLTPMGVWAVINIPIGSSGVHEWLPEGKPERLRYEQFCSRFGSDQLVLISWDGASLTDSRLEQFVVNLESHPEFDRFFSKIESPQRIAESLELPPLRLSQTDVASRLNGVFIGPEGTAAFLLGIQKFGVSHAKETIELIRSQADTVPNLGRENIKLVGTLYEAYAVDEAAEGTLKKLVLPSSLLGLLISWLCLGRLRSAMVVLAIAGLGQLVAVSLVYYTGLQFSAVLIVLPTLVFMLTLSGAVHLINYFADAATTIHHAPNATNLASAGIHAVSYGWKPCLLSSLTTMLGMGSLITSQLIPVRQFGIYSAIGLGIATLLLLIAFPAVADWICGSRNRVSSSQADVTTHQTSTTIQFPISLQNRYIHWQHRVASIATLASIALLLATFIGLSQLKSSTKFCDMFPENSRTNSDMKWFESNIGPIATVEVLLHFKNADSTPILDQSKIVYQLTKTLKDHVEVGGVYSAMTFLPRWPEGGSTKAVATRSVLRYRLENNLEQFAQQGVLFRDSEETIWRLMAKVSAVSDKSYGELTDAIRLCVSNDLKDSPVTSIVRTEYTGLSPVMHETQVTLLTDLGYSFLSAFALITPVMMWMVRSFLGGLLIMIPNVLPVTLAFGIMGWMGWSLDIAGILTASIALGIAVDDTLHFSCWYMQQIDKGLSRLEAIRNTFSNCSSAMLHTTLISCGAMTPFLFADFLPTQQFAKLMIAMLLLAIVGDLFVLPALLLSPLGKVIGRRNNNRLNRESSIDQQPNAELVTS